MLTVSSAPHMAEKFQQQTRLNLADRTHTHIHIFVHLKTEKLAQTFIVFGPHSKDQ